MDTSILVIDAIRNAIEESNNSEHIAVLEDQLLTLTDDGFEDIWAGEDANGEAY